MTHGLLKFQEFVEMYPLSPHNLNILGFLPLKPKIMRSLENMSHVCMLVNNSNIFAWIRYSNVTLKIFFVESI